MTTQDIVRYWKDPESRDGQGIDHPAGTIDLPAQAVGAAEAGTTTITTVTVATEAISCWLSCDASFHKGTCAFVSYGCCAEAAV